MNKRRPKQILLVTGMSGAGRSTALAVLEDLGYEAIYVAESWGRDQITLLTMMALNTTRIRLGTGIAGIWAEMLLRGAGTRSSREHADACDRIGANRNAEAGNRFLRVGSSLVGTNLIDCGIAT